MSVLKVRDPETKQFVSIRTIQGEQGPQGPKGDSGFCALHINEQGHLILTYQSDESVPNYYINSLGHLILSL